MLLQLSDVNKIYNGNVVLSHIDLTIEPQDRIGMIGVNGCGKTTLLRLITGKELPDHMQEGDGSISYAPDLSVGYLEQTGALDAKRTVYAEMQSVFQRHYETQEKMHRIEAAMSSGEGVDAEEYHRLQTWFETNDGYTIDVKIRTVLTGMGFLPDTWERSIHSFSGGEKTRLALVKLLLEAPDLLILDEPTNHLDFQTVMWLEEYLSGYKDALLIVSHDRFFLDRLCTSICEIECTRLTRYKGNYSAYVPQKEAAIARQWKEYELQQKEIDKLEDYIARNQTRASTAKSAQSRIRQLEKMERIEKPPMPLKKAHLDFGYDVQPPVELLKVQQIDISVGEGTGRRTLLPSLSFEVRRGEKWGIIGENGIGKSTLLKELQGILPHEGRVRWTSNVKIAYFDQEGENLHPEKTVMEEIHDRVPSWTNLEVRNLLGRVRLTGEQVFKRVGVLSGGERAKVCFAVMLLSRANVLILDEPTNHLDIGMKEVVEEALCAYTGTVIFVSHDRYLLDKVADHILFLHAQGAQMVTGGFSAWQAQQKTEAEPEAPVQEKTVRQTEKVKAHGKKQRADRTRQRLRMRELEAALEQNENTIEELNARMQQEDVAADYQQITSLCEALEQLQQQNEEIMEEMILLEDEMNAG